MQLVPAYIGSILFGAIDKLLPDFAILKSKAIRFYHKSTRVCPGIEGNIPKMSALLKSLKKEEIGCVHWRHVHFIQDIRSPLGLFLGQI